MIEESDAAGNMQEAYVFFGGKRIANRVVSSGVISYYAEDFIGSSRVITTSAGATCYDADFYPYGSEGNVTNTCPQNYKWTGKERDAETGNDDFDARYYSPVYGRFLSADWSAMPVAVPYANLTNPQTLNLYAIVRDNPESFADLDGHCGEPISFTVCAGIVILGAEQIYDHFKVLFAKGDNARAAVQLERTCAMSSTCDIATVHRQTVTAVQDAHLEAAETALATVPLTAPPTSSEDLIIGGVADQIKAAAIEQAKKQAEQLKQREKEREQQQNQQEEQQKEEEKRRREEEEKRLRKQQKPQEVCQQGSACT